MLYLVDLIPQAAAVAALPPEELAMAVLKTLNPPSDFRVPRNQTPSEISRHNYCNQQAQRYEDSHHNALVLAIATAFQYLVTTGMVVASPFSFQGGLCVLTQRAQSLKTDTDYQRFRHSVSYPRGTIDPAIEEVTFAEFMKGDYETAVFKAFKLLEDLVRRTSGAGNEEIGIPLMRSAFHPKNGPLTDQTENTGEQEALMHLMAGAIGRFKNPTSHRFTGLDDPRTTIEILQLASLLVRIASERAMR